MPKNVLILEKKDINVTINENMNRIKILLEDGNQIWMSVEVARKLSVELDSKVIEADIEFE